MTNDNEICSEIPNLLLLDDSLKTVLDSLPYYAILLDEDHRIVFANKSVARYKNDKLCSHFIGEYCPNVMHGTKAPIKECPLVQSMATSKIAEKEVYDEKNESWVNSAIYPTGMKTESGKKIFFHTIQDITETKAVLEHRKQIISKLNRLSESSIIAITRIVEKRDAYTSGHQKKVSTIAYKIASELGLDKNVAKGVKMAGMLHDVGKIGVPIKILTKPGELNQNEREIIETHPRAGYDILKDVEFEWPIADIVLQHHERLDGSGYPNRLKGEQIILEARIIGVADVFDAMTSYRPYRPGLDPEEVLNELEKNAAKLYDQSVVNACIKLYKEGKIKVED